jgi:hypothetical protein
VYPHFWNDFIRGVCFAFWEHPIYARRIFAAAYAPRFFQTSDLTPLSLQLLLRIYERGSWNPHHELARDASNAAEARVVPPLSYIPPDTIPGLDWGSLTVASSTDFARLRRWLIDRLVAEFSWVLALVHAEDPRIALPEFVARYLAPEGPPYFAAGNGHDRGGFLPHLYELAPWGPLDFWAAHTAIRQLEAGEAPSWFAVLPDGVFRSEAERSFVRASFDPTPVNQEEPLTFEERLALFLVYRAQLDIPQITALLGQRTFLGQRISWATDPVSTAEHIYHCFVQVLRSWGRARLASA